MAEAWFTTARTYADAAICESLLANIPLLERVVSDGLSAQSFIRIAVHPRDQSVGSAPGLLLPSRVGGGGFDLLMWVSQDDAFGVIGRERCVGHVHGGDEWDVRFGGTVKIEPDDSELVGVLAWADDIAAGRRVLVDVIPDQRPWNGRRVRYGATSHELTADSIWAACETAIEYDATEVRFVFFDGSYDRTVSAASPEPVLRDLGL